MLPPDSSLSHYFLSLLILMPSGLHVCLISLTPNSVHVHELMCNPGITQKLIHTRSAAVVDISMAATQDCKNTAHTMIYLWFVSFFSQLHNNIGSLKLQDGLRRMSCNWTSRSKMQLKWWKISVDCYWTEKYAQIWNNLRRRRILTQRNTKLDMKTCKTSWLLWRLPGQKQQ